jgi:hypothetical protein
MTRGRGEILLPLFFWRFKMGSLLLYSPSDVVISIAGLHTVAGLADGTFINISKDVDPFEVQRAMDGSIQRIYRHDEGFQLDITLAQSSPSNNILSALYNIDTVTQLGKFPVFITDGRGSTKFFALTAWVDRLPDTTFASTLETRNWRLHCTQATLTVGGNADQSAVEKALDFGVSLLPLFKDFGVF